MTDEKRRYFRINETIGLSYEPIGGKAAAVEPQRNILDMMSEQDEKIEQLLLEVDEESPKVAALVRAFNQKLERIVSQLVMDNRLVDQIANRVKEVNISACGIGFVSDTSIETGARLSLELELFPNSTVIKTKGLVVACDPVEGGFFWRVDFYDLRQAAQEVLIQHIVQRQSAQLKTIRTPGGA